MQVTVCRRKGGGFIAGRGVTERLPDVGAGRQAIPWLLPFLFCSLLWLILLRPAYAEVPPVAIGVYNPIIRDVPRKDAELSLRFWLAELGASVQLKYKPIRFYDDLGQMKRDLDSGELNFIVATSMGVVQHIPLDQLRDGFTGQKPAADDLYLVVRRAANIRTLADLAGKRFVLLDGDELSDVYLQVLLMRSRATVDASRLAAIDREKRSANLVHRLFFNRADAGLISRNAYEAALELNPQIGQRLQILDEYSFRGRSPVVGLFSAQMASDDRAIITRAAMSISGTARGRQLLDIYRADSMEVSSVSDLEPYRRLFNEYQTLRGQGSSAKKGGS